MQGSACLPQGCRFSLYLTLHTAAALDVQSAYNAYSSKSCAGQRNPYMLIVHTHECAEGCWMACTAKMAIQDLYSSCRMPPPPHTTIAIDVAPRIRAKIQQRCAGKAAGSRTKDHVQRAQV